MSVPGNPLLTLSGVEKYFPIRKGFPARVVANVRAVEPIDLAIADGEVLGVVGESGSGKSTLGRLALRLTDPTAGRIEFDGIELTTLSRAAMRPLRRRMQMIFQDPYSSLNPRMTIRDAIAEALIFHGIVTRREVDEHIAGLLRQVGLNPDVMRRYPRAFSGGQRQRIAFARALAVRPQFIVADEPASALDVSIQAEVINLIKRLRGELGLTMMFISHDLSVVEIISDRVLVLYLGRPMEVAPVDALFDGPRHPYTRALLSAVPGYDGDSVVVEGEIPSSIDPPSGCVFRTRCPFALAACAETVPALREVVPGHQVACIRDDVTG